MRFFIDTADINEIRELNKTGLIDGVTTNPSLIVKNNKDFKSTIKDICNEVNGPVSAEVISTKENEMYEEAMILSKVAENVVIKLPLTWDGLKTCKKLSDQGIKTNITLCFSANQALLAAKAGATYISPFIGRLDDISFDGVDLIADIKNIYFNYNFTTEILAASIRSPSHVLTAAKIGADVVTLPPKILKQLVNHPLTDIGLETFLKDWKNSEQKILLEEK